MSAAEAVEKVRAGDAGTDMFVTMDVVEGEVRLVEHAAAEDVGTVAAALSPTSIAFVYGAVVLDETKGSLEVASESLGRRKLVLVTWIGSKVPPTLLTKSSPMELRTLLREKLPDMVVHVEITANAKSEASQEEILKRVKVASGAFYDSGAMGADQTVESCASAVGSATISDPTSKAKPPSSARGGGRRLVKKAAPADAE